MSQSVPLIRVSGPPDQRGRAYGVQAVDRIARGIDHYRSQLQRLGVTQDDLRRWVAEYLPVIERFEPAYVEEMHGIAAGAHRAFEDIVLLNARTEILKLGERPDLRAVLADEACTAVVVLPEATADGQLIQAQNWDWKAECAETAVVLEIQRDDGPDILTFTEAGGLARSGLNSAGIAVVANYLQSDRDYRRLGVPLALIRRKALEQQHLALAFHAVAVTPKSAANNMIVGHAEGIAIDFECAPDEAFRLEPEDGLLVHANHFVSPIALAKLMDTGIAETPDSLYRDIRVRSLLKHKLGSVTVGDVKSALLDDFQSPWSVCRPVRPNLQGVETATVAMIVMRPALGEMEVALMPADGARFERFTVSEADHPRSTRPAAE